jgi:hypothetical protein
MTAMTGEAVTAASASAFNGGDGTAMAASAGDDFKGEGRGECAGAG